MIKNIKPQFFIGLSLFFILLACNKNEVNITPTQTFASKVIASLKDSVSTQDFTSLDSKKTIVYKLDEEHKLLHISTQDSNRFVLVETDNTGSIIKGKILQFTPNVNGVKSNQSIFNGKINVSSLNGNLVKHSVIVNNQVSKDPNNSSIISNYFTDKIKPSDDIPEVTIDELTATVLGIRHLNNGASDLAFNLLLVSGIGDPNEYVPIYPDYGDGSGDILIVNIDIPEEKKPVDPQKMIDCFGTISSVGASYSISINANLPVDNNPDITVNGFDGGHAFLILTKNNSNGESITQVMGFYPTITLIAALTAPVPSVIVNDEAHKFGASYTINVNANQFQSALNQIVSLSSNYYSLSTFNCTTFALNVLNSAGTSLNVTPFAYLPGINYSNFFVPTALPVFTPNNLYKQIQNLSNSGDPNAKIGIAKATSSHGPC